MKIMAGNNSTSATWAWFLMNWLVLPKADGYVPMKQVGGFKYFLFSSLPGEIIQFDQYFSSGLKPPNRKVPDLFWMNSNSLTVDWQWDFLQRKKRSEDFGEGKASSIQYTTHM